MRSSLRFFVFVCCGLFFVWACDPTPSTSENNQESSPQETKIPDGSAQPDGQTTTENRPPNEKVVTPEKTPEPTQPPKEQSPSEKAPPEASPEKTPDTSTGPWKDPTVHQGKATYYDADGTGNCSFPKASSPPLVAAMNEQEYGNAEYCGACVKVDGPNGSVVVHITDRCPECTTGHLDLSREAFAMIGEPKQGIIPITWQVISCPDNGTIRYHYKDGSSQWWTAIQIRNHRLPIKQVEIWKNNQWQVLTRQRYNYFLDDKGAGPDPVRIRLTAANGQVLEEQLPAPASDLEVVGKKQF